MRSMIEKCSRRSPLPASSHKLTFSHDIANHKYECPQESERHHFRFHLPHAHLDRIFGNDWFALKAEAFARFFGTPLFLVAQTIIVGVWILVNAAGVTKFDVYPFILLNLAFSLQAAYAAPLILVAQTRQADRDKAHAEADTPPPGASAYSQHSAAVGKPNADVSK
jgi:uncharacterized protein DUF1003